MVDLFGRKKLEDRILELEAGLAKLEREKDDLFRTLEKRDEKIKKLSAANQEANIALKAAEQRAAAVVSAPSCVLPQSGVHGQVELTFRRQKLGLRETGLLLQRLSFIRSPREDLLAAYYPGAVPEDGLLPAELSNAASSVKSCRGEIILHSPQLFSMILIPPFPVSESLTREAAAFYLDPLREMMDTPVLVVSAHAGDTFIGVALSRDGFEAEELVESGVMGKHSKGGWSQKRFERLREEDIKGHVDLVNGKLAELMGKYKTLLKYAVLSGEEGLVRQIAPGIGLPVVQRRLERHDERNVKGLLDEVYGLVCYRIEV